MMTVADIEKYERYRHDRAARSRTAAVFAELWLPTLLFGSIGAIAWAIRGSNGWGGIDGTIVPGMTWGLLWYYVCSRRGIDARGIPLWLGLGISVGGELGYGQYVSWIQGNFNVGDEIIPIAPWIGYAWFVLAGIGWGATGGIALGWTLSGKTSLLRWLIRLLIPMGVAYLGWLLVQAYPWVFFPNHNLNIYAGQLDHHLERTVYTNTQNFTVVAWWAGALLVAAFQKDKVTLTIGTLIGAGFGIGFTLGALWCLGYSYAPAYIDWWKVWELNAGFNLGFLYVLALTWATHRVDRSYDRNGLPRITSNKPSVWRERRLNVSLTFSVFLLLFILFRGGSLSLGGLLGFYDVKKVDQYTWPPARTVIFAVAVIPVISAALLSLWRNVRASGSMLQKTVHPAGLPERMADLITGIAAVGVVTIWPSKIAVLYALFLCLAIFSLNRLNRKFDCIDAS